MAIQVNIEKNFKGFSLKSVFESNTSATGILGASGSGKSMTLRCIAGIETPDRGKIVINGRTVFDSEKKINLKPQERRIGYLFQNYALFPWLKVGENIEYPMKKMKVPKEERKKKLKELLEMAQLTKYENYYIHEISGGMKQRVALLRALACDPKVLLMDEPTSALDPISTSRIEELTMELKERYTIVIVTHNMQQAVRISDRTAFFLLGELVEYGATEQVFSAPAEKRTEDYITGRFG